MPAERCDRRRQEFSREQQFRRDRRFAFDIEEHLLVMVDVRAEYRLHPGRLMDHFAFDLQLADRSAGTHAGVRRAARESEFEQSRRLTDGETQRARGQPHPGWEVNVDAHDRRRDFAWYRARNTKTEIDGRRLSQPVRTKSSFETDALRRASDPD